MILKKLRWLSIVLPVVLAVLLELAEDFIMVPTLGRTGGHILTFIIITASATTLSYVVFTAFHQMHAHLLRQNQELKALNEISQVVSSGLEFEEISRRALEKVLEISGSDAGEIILYDAENDRFETLIYSGPSLPESAICTVNDPNTCVAASVLQSGQQIVIRDIRHDMRFTRKPLIDIGMRALTCVPLRSKDKVLGVLTVFHRHRIYTIEAVSLLAAIANNIALAIDNSKLYTRVEEAMAYLNAVITSSGDAIITTDLQGNIKSWNPGAEHVYGWKQGEVIGTYLPMVPDSHMDEARDMIMRLKKGETIYSHETERLHKSGHCVQVVVTASPVLDPLGNLVGIAGISRDISENRRLQAEISRQRQSLAVLEERERIAREMHDGLAQVLGYVNTKAQAVRRFIQVGKTQEAQEHLEQLESAARTVYTEVRETIFGLRNSTTGGKDLRQVLNEYLERYEAEWQITTHLEIQDESLLDQFALPVEVQLIRIIQEALTNVHKHADAEKVCITFERDDQTARIVIVDDGKGFNPQQSAGSEWPRFGLQIMRERAEGVDGSLTISSLANHGTCVCLCLPIEEKQGMKEAVQ